MYYFFEYIFQHVIFCFIFNFFRSNSIRFLFFYKLFLAFLSFCLKGLQLLYFNVSLMQIVKNSKIYVAISAVFLIISIFLIFAGKLNLGIDMTGGIQMDYNYSKNIDITAIQKDLKTESESFLNDGKQVINNTSAYKITGENTLSAVVGFYNDIDDKTLDTLKEDFRAKTLAIIKAQDDSAIEAKYVNIGKSFGDYIKDTAILTLAIAIVAIAIYVTYAFSGVIGGISIWSFAVITIITLFHDVLISTGLYVGISSFFPEFKIDTFFVTALLTILGYSINDTIVVFDRIRGNLKQFGGKTGKDAKNLEEIVDLSITETVTRSIYTSLTLAFVLITIFFFGPETIKGFVLVMIFGTIVGTYSSIFIASPILYMVNKNKKLSVYKKVVIDPEDKIVV
ncbi:protein translocase subunit SecF [Candidatus Gracilibacteria bacterium 28_42_T64]|nr:protein translocase subunit SecF [Candidatus Gracilibacteria bacterium 28_42_T64]